MSGRPGPRPWVCAAAIAFAAIVAFGRSAWCGWIWDDPEHVTGNVVLRSAAGFGDIWLRPESLPQWYPLVHSTFWVEHHLYGDQAAGYHVLNVLLHALNGILLWRVLARVGLPGAWIAGLLFAVHPVHAESVAWVSERKNVLSGAFYLGSLLAWLRFAGLAEGAPESRRGRTWVLAFLLFVAALLSKSVTATLPAVALVIAWWKRGSITKRDFLPLLPFFVVGAALGLHTAWMERSHVGAEGADWTLTLADRFVLAGEVLWFYASKLAVPWRLTFVYPRWPVDAGTWWQWLFPIGALGGMAVLWANRERIGRGPLAAILVFAGTLFPALGFLNVYPFRYSWVADHFQYLASAALLALAGVGLARAVAALEPRLGGAARFLPVPLVALLAALSFLQCAMYEDEETLWTETLARNPAAGMAYNNLSVLRIQKGDYRGALEFVKVAVSLNRSHHEGWNNLGSVLSGFKDYAGAEAAYRQAIELMPGFAIAWTNLGEVLEKQNRPEEALAAFRKSVALDSPWRGGFRALVRALVDRKLFAEAAETGREALRRYPRDVRLPVQIGGTMTGGGAAAEAIPILEEAVRRDPRDIAARLELGRARFSAGRPDEAAREFGEAVRLDPADASARLNLGTALKGTGDLAGAEREWREALRLDPGNEGAAASLGRLLAEAGRLEEAAPIYDAALRGSPDSWFLRYGRARLRLLKRAPKEALEDLREVGRGNPEYQPALRDLAWLLATCADTSVRAPDAAVVAAEHLVSLSKRRDPAHLDVLAAALASAERYEEAGAVAEEALRLEPPPALAEAIRARAALYRERKSFTE
jgi:tetratricopeptide (TPR) repeat protein